MWAGSAAAAVSPEEKRPFFLGGIQLNEDDHERWAASLIQAGMNAVEVTVYAQQGAWHTPELWYADEEPAVLDEIRTARRNGLQVVLILRVALDHNDPENRFLWHGLVYPRTEAQLAEWFRRYGDFVVHWARIAQEQGVEVLGIASEMNSLLATLPVEDIPNLPAYYLDDIKQEELRDLVERHRHLFEDADWAALGAGDFTSLDEFLKRRNHVERQWARVYTFAEEGADETVPATEEEVAAKVRKINLRRSQLDGHWRELIDRVEAVYRGHLTLAANFDNYHEVSFWDRLDFMGINAYFPLRATLESPLEEAALTEAWRQIFKDIQAFQASHELEQPVIFTELGYTQRQGVSVAPWSSTGLVPMWDDEGGDSVLLWSAQPIEPEERALAVRALVSAWLPGDSPLAGVLYWKLSSRVDLGRYEPFMLYLGTDSSDPLLADFTRFADHIQPFDPLFATAATPYARSASAVTRGDVEQLTALEKVDFEPPKGTRPLLHLAVQRGQTEIVQRLLDLGAEADARDDAGYLPLHWTCYQSDPSLVSRLLPSQDVSWLDHRGETPHMKCARLDNPGVLQELLRHRPDLASAQEETSRNALHLAADLASPEMIGLLMSHGAKASAPDQEGVTPLHVAARRGDPGIVTPMLVAAGGQFQDEGGNRPAGYAAYYGKAQAFQLLWNRRSVGEQNTVGQSLLHLAAHGGDLEILTTLLRQGLEINRVDRDGRTPLHFAVQKAHRSATRRLLERGAEIDRADAEGRTAAHLAAEQKDAKLLELVLARSPKLDAPGVGGNTPLHYAAGWGRLENVRLLLAAGAQPEARNDLGQTALEVAEESGRKRVVELLRSEVAANVAPAADAR